MDKNWKLQKIIIEFKKGYFYNKTEDRYEGYIEFSNEISEFFKVQITEEMSKSYLKLIANEVIDNAKQLANKLENSLLNEEKE
jgi:hypothetical protein